MHLLKGVLLNSRTEWNDPEWTGVNRNGPDWAGMNQNGTGINWNEPE